MVMDGTALVASGQQLRSTNGILLELLSLNEAKLRDDWDKWQQAMINEMTSMNKMVVFELADIPLDGKLIGVRWVFKLKLDAQRRATQYKDRLVAQGYAQHQGLDYDQTFSPVVRLQTVQMLLALTQQYGLYVSQLDVSTAFLNGKIDKNIHVQIPPTFEAQENDSKCYKLKKALYGLKQAGRLWHAALDEQLQALPNRAMSTTSRVQLVRQQLSSVFSITDQGNISHNIGLSVQYRHEERTLSIDQSGYIEGILVKFGMNEAWTASMLATESINNLKPREGDAASAEEVWHYALLVGSLLWIAQGSRPDIAFAVGRCTRFVANPSGEHLTAAKRILRYLKGTIKVSLTTVAPVGGQMLTGWADSDWASSRDCRRSTSGYVFTIDGLVCSWSSRLQPTVANSSVEAEYMALAGAARELLWTTMFLHKAKQPMSKTAGIHVSAGTSVLHSHNSKLTFNRNVPILHSDSSGACAIANDPQHFKKTKHIDIAHFFLRDEIAS
ncbi:uncharacterized protein UDID_19160 [Ustilago sp. UG-2017a]|nr:uncharacterized protein UDID_19160 [Ustilago sp. UG-2017a]